MIAIVDYGIGNLASVAKAFKYVGAEPVLSADPSLLRTADALVLPGDGAFGATMDEVRRRGLAPLLLEASARGTPLLGICIGMQILFEQSEEHGRHEGLGLLSGRVRRFETTLPVPHMGWNALRRVQAHPLLDGIGDGAHLYFVHSYYCEAAAEDVLATSDYEVAFPAVVGRGSVLAVQFHPEKSQAVGLRLIENWLRCARGERFPEPHTAASALPSGPGGRA